MLCQRCCLALRKLSAGPAHETYTEPDLFDFYEGPVDVLTPQEWDGKLDVPF